jgi:hypothetical protein
MLELLSIPSPVYGTQPSIRPAINGGHSTLVTVRISTSFASGTGMTRKTGSAFRFGINRYRHSAGVALLAF